ncbi:hypothetical protein AU15_15325 [Marinobacter salarius]|uniref:Uncharacterized protein n=1 Tax=Marinobacter salarius TaxID=1420917 RepID=W5Z472_9GAMM|nr:hypothetical protein AU15_15325 [Marinobacter salarius]
MYTWCDLTKQLPFAINIDELRRELDQLKDDSWLEHYDVTLSRGWKSIPLVSKNGEASGPESQRAAPYEEMKRTEICADLPAFSSLLDSFHCPQGASVLPDWILVRALINTEMSDTRLPTSPFGKFAFIFQLRQMLEFISGSTARK